MNPPDRVPGVGMTAFAVATARAIESERPGGLVVDSFARHFARSAGLPRALPVHDRDIAGDPTASFWGGLAGYMGLRSRVFDEHLLGSVRAGVRQVVIVAAGLDARALRLDWPPGTTVFEVDGPAVLAAKQQVLDDLDAAPACRRILVPTDLRADWSADLLGAGLAPGRPTAWLVEGLLPYLSPEAEESLFAAIARLAAPGSTLAVEAPVLATIDVVRRGQPASGGLSGWLGVDVAALWNTDPRPGCADLLRSAGWEVDVESGTEAARRYDRVEAVRAAGPMADSLLITAHRPVAWPVTGDR